MISHMGLDYTRYHACVNDCVLFCKENENARNCPKCGESRYEDVEGGIPRKVLQHFPLKIHLEHMFCTIDLADLMVWHSKHQSKDDTLRVPSDCEAFKNIDATWPMFKEEPRNVKLGIALDGINPFSNQSSRWSSWPVAVINYNIPPFLAIRKEHILLSLLILGNFIFMMIYKISSPI